MQPLRILFVTTGLGTGGAERMLVKVVAALTDHSCNFMVASLLDEGTQGDSLRQLGAPVAELKMNRPSGFLSLPFRLRKIVRKYDPHVIQGWMYHGNLAATFARSVAGSSARLFWGVRQTFYGMNAERPFTRLVIRANAAKSKAPDSIIFNSRLSLEQHCSIGFRPENSIVIPNGFDTDRFWPDAAVRSATRRRLELPEQAEVVGLLARDHPMKDHASFVRAAAAVARARPGVWFVLAGKGVDSGNSRLAALIGDAGLDDRVRLLGEVKEAESLFPAFDVSVLSSAWGDAFPNVLGEAMACGVPCVSTDVGDAGHIVGDAGRIVRRADSESLAAAIVELLHLGPEARRLMGAHGRQRVEELFSLEAVARQYLALYSAGRTATPS